MTCEVNCLGERHIFVTGAPGVLGTALLKQLQSCYPAAHVSVFVRKEYKETLQGELAGYSAKVLTGEIGQPYLGLAPGEYETLRKSVTHIYHADALMDLAAAREDLYSVNVLGTENVAHMATQAPNLHGFVYVSTAFVSGRQRGASVSEDSLDEDQRFRSYYEQSRFLAEQAVQSVRRKKPVIIVRPAVIVSKGSLDPYGTRSLLFDWVRLAKFASGLPGGGMLPADDTPCYAVSVERLVETVGRLSTDPKHFDQVYHVVDPNPQTGSELSADLYQLVRGRPASRTCSRWLLGSLLTVPWISRRIGAALQSAAYLRCNPSLDAGHLREALAGLDSEWPSVGTYLAAMSDTENSDWGG